MPDKNLKMLVVDEFVIGESILYRFKDSKKNVKVKLVDSTREALLELMNPYDVLVCHVGQDEGEVASFAKNRWEEIFAIGVSGGGFDYDLIKSLGYDTLIKCDYGLDSIYYSLGEEVEKKLVGRGLM